MFFMHRSSFVNPILIFFNEILFTNVSMIIFFFISFSGGGSHVLRILLFPFLRKTERRDRLKQSADLTYEEKRAVFCSSYLPVCRNNRGKRIRLAD